MMRPRGVCRVWLFAYQIDSGNTRESRVAGARGNGDVVDRPFGPVYEPHRELDAAGRQFDDQPLAERLP